MEYVLSTSHGKDSMACIYVILEVLHWPLDRIVHAEVWATDDTPADPPEMVEWKRRAEETSGESGRLKAGFMTRCQQKQKKSLSEGQEGGRLE